MSWNGYLAIGTSTSGVFTESTATGYARLAFTLSTPNGGKLQGTGATISFTATGAVVSTYNSFAFYAAVSGGAPILVYPRLAPFSFGVGASLDVSPPNIVLDVVDCLTGTGLPLEPNGLAFLAGTQPAGLMNTATTRVTGQTNVTSSTALVAITGLSATLVAGATYVFDVYLPITATATPGFKVAMDSGGSLTATSISYSAQVFNNLTTSAAAVVTSLGAATAATLAGTFAVMRGTIVVNAGGTLVVKIAQNVSNGTATSALVNGYLNVTRIA